MTDEFVSECVLILRVDAERVARETGRLPRGRRRDDVLERTAGAKARGESTQRGRKREGRP
jgi:hypothetical protein